MSEALTDRSVLVGVLALQHQFVNRDALLKAHQTWQGDPSRSLGDVLVHEHRLSPSQLAALNAVVDELLKQHEGSSQKCLNALRSSDSVGPDLENLFAPTLVNTTDSTVPWDKTKGGRAPAASSGQPSAPRARFRILRPLAEGGLGIVSVAHDEELNRTVAFKEIRREYADDDDSRMRFLREAEITGGLEHPSIVPVYGLGKDAAGRPCYAMRLIRGETLAAAIRSFHGSKFANAGERSLALRRLLQQFIAVCQAVEYAHSRGVLHRDIKPSNIMLGKFGETLVVDWGLAKVARLQADADTEHRLPLEHETPLRLRGAEEEQTGAGVGTPGYMPAEQALGQIERMGPTADVYALGATLYQLLTSHTPIERCSVAEMVQRQERGIPGPRIRDARIERALEAICMKALAFLPQERYPSAAALADDLEHYLADEPIQALPDSTFARLGRVTRRHRQWVLAGAAALGLVAVVASVAFVRMRRDAEINRANLGATVQLLGFLDKVLGEPFPQFDSVRLEQRKPVEALATDIHAWVDSPGRRPELQKHAIRPLIWLGNMHADVGDGKEALSCFQKALRREETLTAAELQELAPTLTEARVRAAYVLAMQSDFDASDALYRAAIAGGAALPPENPGLARANYHFAESLLNQGHFKEAQSFAEVALTQIEQSLAKAENPTKLEPDLEQACNMLGRVRTSAGRFPEGLALHQRATALFPKAQAWSDELKRDPAAKPFNAQSPEDLTECQGFVNALTNQVVCLIPQCRFAEALDALSRQVTLRDGMDREDVAGGLVTYAQGARIFHEHHQPAMADAYLSRFAALAEQNAGEPGAFFNVVLGRARLELGRPSAAQNLLAARDAYERLGNPLAAMDVAISKSNYGRWLQLRGDAGQAQAILREAIGFMEQQKALDVFARDALAAMYERLSEALHADPAGRSESAQTLAKAKTLRAQLVKDSPAASLYHYRLAELLLTHEPLSKADAEEARQILSEAHGRATANDQPFFEALLATACCETGAYAEAEAYLKNLADVPLHDEGLRRVISLVVKRKLDPQTDLARELQETRDWIAAHDPHRLLLKRLLASAAKENAAE